MNDEQRYDIAYHEATRSIEDQQRSLDATQARAGFVGSAAAVLAGLSVRSAPLPNDPSGPVKLLLIGYVVVGILVVFVLWPRTKWRFHFQASALHWQYIEGPAPQDSRMMKRDLALYLDRYFAENAGMLDRMNWALAGALTLLLVNSGILVYDLIGG